MDDAAWAALAGALTLAGAGYTAWAYRARGTAAALRGLALTLLPVAAWLTGTLRMLARIVDAVADWATHLVFSPSVWLGTILAGLAVVLWVVGGVLKRRRGPAEVGAERREALPRTQPKQPPIDDELAEIEALLKRRGIS